VVRDHVLKEKSINRHKLSSLLDSLFNNSHKRIVDKMWLFGFISKHSAADRRLDLLMWLDLGEYISGLVRIRAISPTEKRSSKLLSFLKFFTDRMSQ